MAQRPPREQSLFDTVDPQDPDPADPGRRGAASSQPAAIRPAPPASGGGAGTTEGVPLHEAAQSRYLNYALSVITASA